MRKCHDHNRNQKHKKHNQNHHHHHHSSSSIIIISSSSSSSINNSLLCLTIMKPNKDGIPPPPPRRPTKKNDRIRIESITMPKKGPQKVKLGKPQPGEIPRFRDLCTWWQWLFAVTFPGIQQIEQKRQCINLYTSWLSWSETRKLRAKAQLQKKIGPPQAQLLGLSKKSWRKTFWDWWHFVSFCHVQD